MSFAYCDERAAGDVATLSVVKVKSAGESVAIYAHDHTVRR